MNYACMHSEDQPFKIQSSKYNKPIAQRLCPTSTRRTVKHPVKNNLFKKPSLSIRYPNIWPITPNIWTIVANFNCEKICQESVITKTVIQKLNLGYSIVQYQADYGEYSTRQTARHCLSWHSRSKMSKSTIKRRRWIETRAELPSRHHDYPFFLATIRPSFIIRPRLLFARWDQK